MRIFMMFVLTVFALTTTFTSPARATIVPFTEDFSSGTANWRDSGGVTGLAWSATGGPDGGSYASGRFNFISSSPSSTPAIFRAHDAYDSSGDAFVGNWIADDVDLFSVSVRHDAPTALTFFTRFAPSANFPGAAAFNLTSVPPNTWTTLAFPINAGNPLFQYEGPGVTFNSVFSNIGNVQIGVATGSLSGVDQAYTFDVDKASITPEPATACLLLAGAFELMRRRRKMNRTGVSNP